MEPRWTRRSNRQPTKSGHGRANFVSPTVSILTSPRLKAGTTHTPAPVGVDNHAEVAALPPAEADVRPIGRERGRKQGSLLGDVQGPSMKALVS